MTQTCTLNALPLDKTAVIVKLDSQNALGKRLTDLGVTVGEEITPVLKSPFGDPVAYSVKGCLLGLRRGDCEQVRVTIRENGHE